MTERPGYWPAIHEPRCERITTPVSFISPRDASRHWPGSPSQGGCESSKRKPRSNPGISETKTVLASTLYYRLDQIRIMRAIPQAPQEEFPAIVEIRKELATEPKAKMSQVDLMVALARCGEHAEAARIAEHLVSSPPKDEYLYFQAACGYALASQAASGNDALVSRYQSAAFDCLRQGKKARLERPDDAGNRPGPGTHPRRPGSVRPCSRNSSWLRSLSLSVVSCQLQNAFACDGDQRADQLRRATGKGHRTPRSRSGAKCVCPQRRLVGGSVPRATDNGQLTADTASAVKWSFRHA